MEKYRRRREIDPDLVDFLRRGGGGGGSRTLRSAFL
jgi:hypothetical protein